MKFYIADTFTSGSGQKFTTKEDFLRELSLMIDDCVANGGTTFDITVDTDASCFIEDDDYDPDLYGAGLDDDEDDFDEYGNYIGDQEED